MEYKGDAQGVTASDGGFAQGILLRECPRCGYALTGLPSAHRCPECGFEYDDRTFVLTGISRGTRSMSSGRKMMWGALVGGVSLWPAVMILLALGAAGAIACVVVSGLLLGLFVYLLMTGSRERGLERFLFAAGGFGYCSLNPQGVADTVMTPWTEVDAVSVERKGANWHRLRIGSASTPGGRLHKVRFDAGICCDATAAAWVAEALTDRIRAARTGIPDENP